MIHTEPAAFARMQGSKRVFVAVIAVVVLVALALVFWTPDPHAAERSDEQRNGAARAADAELAHVDLAASAPSEAFSERRGVEAHSGVAASTQAAASVPPATGPFVVRLVYADETWFERRTEVSDSNPFSAYRPRRTGTLLWSDGVDAPAEYAVSDDCVTLPRIPNAAAEFTQLDMAELALRPIALERVGGATSTEFELQVEFEPGAKLVWAASVASELRQPVDVAIGGMFAPTGNARMKVGARAGLVDVCRGLELPYVLPLSRESTVVWIGAATLQWRSYTIEPTDTLVEVELDPTATIRVLHEATDDDYVTVQSFPRGRPVRHPIASAEPLVVAGLASGRHRVWIENAAHAPLSHVAEVELVAGESKDVDVRAAAALDGLGGVRVVVRGAPSVLSLAPSVQTSGLKKPPPESSRVSLTVFRVAPDASKDNRVGRPDLVETTESAFTYETIGLAPGRHVVCFEPFGAWAELDVVAGEVTEVMLDVGCIGFAHVEAPTGSGGVMRLLVEPLDHTGASPCVIDVPPQQDGTFSEDRPLVCGSYRIRASDDGSAELCSEPFVVTAGVTTTVRLTATATLTVHVVAVDAATGAPVGLDAHFWFAVRAVDAATNEAIPKSSDGLAVDGRLFEGIGWTIERHERPITITVPETDRWTFDPLEPLVLTDGATITLRATAK